MISSHFSLLGRQDEPRYRKRPFPCQHNIAAAKKLAESYENIVPKSDNCRILSSFFMLEAPAYLLHRRTMVFLLRQNTNAPKDQLLSTKTQTPFCNQLFRLPVFPFCGGLCSTARPFFSLICRIFDFYSFWYTPYSLAIKKEMLLQLTFPFLTLFEFVQIGISCFQHFPANR